MLGKEQLRTLSIVAAVILLILAFMIGIMNKSDDKFELKQLQSEYTDFKSVLDSLSENDKKLTDGKDDYDKEKKSYDEDKAAYDKAVAELEKTEAKFDEDVMNYNQKLAQYNVGKDAVSSGKTAYNEGKAQLDAGWDAYNEGSEQLKNYDKAKAQYDKAKAQYDESLAAYNKLTKTISDLEAKGVPHRIALAMVSASAGKRITDDSLAEMKSQLDSAKKQLDTAKKQLDQAAKAKEQLKDAKNQLEKGESELNNAKSQLAAGEKQISKLEKEISGGQGKLNEQQKAISDKRIELEKTKADLDARSEKLKAYEDTAEKAQRSRDNLIDEGYGTAEDDNATILSAAQKHEDKLHGEYLKASISYSVTNITRLLAIVFAVIALLKLRKNKLKPATRFATAATAFGAVSLIASIVFGSVHSLAFAAAVFTAVGVCLTEKPEEA